MATQQAHAAIHEAEHGMLHPRRATNETLGAFLALFFLVLADITDHLDVGGSSEDAPHYVS